MKMYIPSSMFMYNGSQRNSVSLCLMEQRIECVVFSSVVAFFFMMLNPVLQSIGYESSKSYNPHQGVENQSIAV